MMPSIEVCQSSEGVPFSFGRSAGLRARKAITELSRHAPAMHIWLLIFLAMTTCGRIHLLDRRLKKAEGDLQYMRVHLNSQTCIGDPASVAELRTPNPDVRGAVPVATGHVRVYTEMNDMETSMNIVGEEIQTTMQENELRTEDNNQLGRITEDCSSSGNLEMETSYMAREAFKQCIKDRDGQRDFAFLNTGGYVIRSLTSPSFVPSTTWRRRLSWWRALRGSNLQASLPEIALKGDGSAGNCWPLEGQVGQLGIGLSRTIDITSLSIEHIGAQLAQNDITAAPREFELWGLDDNHNQSAKGTLLFKGVYSISSPSSPLQTFEIPRAHPLVYSKVLFKITSNYGHSGFTCIYRVRIHGEPLVGKDI
ncbi:UNC-like C-terminal-domain-containing protein [Melampsora americana]|nr:UNC-like C-terminal-domain-containing protein [Melampsora americana]